MRSYEKALAALTIAVVLWVVFVYTWIDWEVDCVRHGEPTLRALTIGGELGIAVAYTAIPATLVMIWRRLRVRPHAVLLVLYGLFIILCGATHAMGIALFWHPQLYWIAAKLKVITAGVSIAVAYVTWRERKALIWLGEQGAALIAERDEATAARAKAEKATTDLGGALAEAERQRGLAEEARQEAERQAAEATRQAEDALNARAELARTNQALAEINAQLDAARAAESARAREQATRAQTAEAENVTLERMIAELRSKDVRIEAQGEALRTLRTPVLQPLDRVLLSVLIGTLDSEQVAEWRERLLEQIVMTRSRLVIFDMTGLTFIDSEVARAIIQTASGVDLLGAERVVCGMQPLIAMTIVNQGLDLSSLRALPTLREALAMAMKKL